MQGICLLLAASGYLPPMASLGIVVLALTTLIWSFGRDVLWLRRTSRVRDGEVEEMLDLESEREPVTSTS